MGKCHKIRVYRRQKLILKFKTWLCSSSVNKHYLRKNFENKPNLICRFKVMYFLHFLSKEKLLLAKMWCNSCQFSVPSNDFFFLRFRETLFTICLNSSFSFFELYDSCRDQYGSIRSFHVIQCPLEANFFFLIVRIFY